MGILSPFATGGIQRVLTPEPRKPKPEVPKQVEFSDENKAAVRRAVDEVIAKRDVLNIDMRGYDPKMAAWTVDYISGRYNKDDRNTIRKGLEGQVTGRAEVKFDTARSRLEGESPALRAAFAPLPIVGEPFRQAGRALRRTPLGRVPVLGEAVAQQIEFTGSPLGLATLPFPGAAAARLGVPALAGRTALGAIARPALRGAGRAVARVAGAVPAPRGLIRTPGAPATLRQLTGEAFIPRIGVPTAAQKVFGEGLTARRTAELEALVVGREVGALPQIAKRFADLVTQSPKLLRRAAPRAAAAVQRSVEAGVRAGVLTPQAAQTLRGVIARGGERLRALQQPFIAPQFRGGELVLKEVRDLQTSRFAERYLGPNIYQTEVLNSIPHQQLRRIRQPLGVTAGDLSTTAKRLNVGTEHIKDLAPLESRVALGISGQGKLIAKRSVQRQLSEMPEIFTRDAATAVQRGWVPVGGKVVGRGRVSLAKDAVDRFGPLAGGFMEPNTFREFEAMAGSFDKISKWMSIWKPIVTVLNPPVHFANMVSNFLILNAAGIPLWRVDVYAKALRELRRPGSQLVKEATAAGAFSTLPEVGGLQAFLNEAEQAVANNSKSAAGVAMELTSRIANSKGLLGKAGEIYQAEENWAKLAAYIFAKGEGRSAIEAAEFANKWVFNYGDVTPFIRAVRTSPVGIPFITYTMKVVPRMLEVASTRPDKFVMWKNLLDAWNIEAAAKIGMPLSELDKFVELQADLARGRRSLTTSAIETGTGMQPGSILSFFEKVAPRMLLPIRDKRTNAPFFISVSRFTPLGQVLQPRGLISLAPLPTAAIEFATGRRQFGLQAGARFVEEPVADPTLLPELAQQATARRRATIAARFGQQLLPATIAGAVPQAAFLGSPAFQRAGIAGLAAAAARGVPGAAQLQQIVAPHTVQRIARTFIVPRSPGELTAAALLVTPQRLDVAELRRLRIAQMQRATKQAGAELKAQAAVDLPQMGAPTDSSTEAGGF